MASSSPSGPADAVPDADTEVTRLVGEIQAAHDQIAALHADAPPSDPPDAG